MVAQDDEDVDDYEEVTGLSDSEYLEGFVDEADVRDILYSDQRSFAGDAR
jgi:hypothetical protein